MGTFDDFNISLAAHFIPIKCKNVEKIYQILFESHVESLNLKQNQELK